MFNGPCGLVWDNNSTLEQEISTLYQYILNINRQAVPFCTPSVNIFRPFFIEVLDDFTKLMDAYLSAHIEKEERFQ